MAEPFDVALRVLKATLDQQMYAQMPAHSDLAQFAMGDDSLPLGGAVQQLIANQPVGDKTGFLQEYGQQPQMNPYGDRSLGTMHPAIVGMLRRRGGTANVDPRQNQGNPVRITRTPQFAQDAYDLRQEGLGPADVRGQMHPTLGMQQGDMNIPGGMDMGGDDAPMELDAGDEEPEGDEEEMLEEALRGINYVPSQKEIVKTVAKRVAKRLQEAKRAEARLNRALGKKR